MRHALRLRYSAPMRRVPIHRRTILVALLVLLVAAPLVAYAAAPPPGTVVLREVTLATVPRSRAAHRSVELPVRANLLGASWVGTAEHLELRAMGADGRWSRWVELEADGDGPDPSSREARAMRGRKAVTVPVWVGDARRVQLRIETGRARDVRLAAINVTGTATFGDRALGRVRSVASRVLGAGQPTAAAQPGRPPIRLRSFWRAAPAKVTPEYADAALGVVVHHTVTANSYPCSQVPAILRGIQRYHMQSNGWNDIGYNLLVDRCGVAWEGRGGGITSPVVGAHTAGFNTGTVGIALLGTHTSVPPNRRERDALVRLIAWRMDVAHVAPTGRMALTARSGDKFRIGSRVVARAVSGHRNLYPTSCPGTMTYRLLNSIALAAWRRGGVKVANVTVAPSYDETTGLLHRLRVRAVTGPGAGASAVLRLERGDGTVLAEQGSDGPVHSFDLQLDPADTTAVWDARVVIEATRNGVSARRYVHALGSWGSDPGFTVTTPPASTVTPGGDPSDDRVELAYTLEHAVKIGAWLHDPTTGARVATLRSPATAQPAIEPRTLTLSIPAGVAAGSYELRVGADADDAPGRSIERFELTVVR